MNHMAQSGLSLEIQAEKNISYVNYQAYLLQKEATHGIETNPFCFLKSVLIKNAGEEDVKDATLRFDVVPSLIEISNIPLSCIEKGNRGTLIRQFQFFLDPLKLYQLTESLPGSLRATLFDSKGEMLATSSVDLRFDPIELSVSTYRIHDLLASFVTPNEEGVKQIVSSAMEYRKKKYENASFDGYLSHDPNEVLKDIDSVYQTIRSLSLRYIVSPASFDKLFQRVRLPKNVLGDKMGNCLDLSLLFASVIEAIGLRPMLILIRNHCMLGVWLDEEMSVSPLEENGQVIINAASKGFEHLCLLECTAITNEEISFQNAKDIAYKTLQEEKNFHYAIDIHSCRNELIWPIPSLREENGEKKIVIPSISPEQSEKISEVNVDARRYLSNENKRNKNRYEYWEDKLLDLNLANKLLNLKIKANTLQIMVDDAETFLDFLANNEKVSLQEVEQSVLFPDGEIPSFQDALSLNLIREGYGKGRISSFCKAGNKIDAAKALSRKANTSLEESGCNPLFLTLGLIRWYDNEISANHAKGEMYAPLFLLPVRIPKRRTGNTYVLEYDYDEIGLNQTLFEYFKQNFHLDFSSLNELPKKEDGKIDLRMIYNEIRRIITPMKNWLLLENPSILSLFSFSHFVMWSDLKNNKDIMLSNKIVSSFVNADRDLPSDEETSTQEIKNDDVIFPLSADSSQIKAIYDADKGESFILDGPPGTGKSQTIANMIVNLLYHGKKVLFVAEKEVALDVVKRRLDDLSLGQFTLELANIQEPKSQVLETYQKLLSLGGPVANPDGFDECSQKIEEKQAELNSKISSLHEKREFLYSPYQAILSYLENENSGDVYAFSYEFLTNFSESKYEKTLPLLKDIASTSLSFDSYLSSPFLGFQGRSYSMEYRDSMKKEIDGVLPLLERLKLDLYNVFNRQKQLEETYNNAKRYAEILEILREGGKKWPEYYLDETFLEKENEIRSALKLAIDITKNKEKILVSFNESFLNQNGEELEKEFLLAESLSFFPRHKALSLLRKKLKPFAKSKEALKKDGLKDELELLKRIQEQNKELAAFDSYVRFFLKNHPFLTYPDGEEVLHVFETTIKIAKNTLSLDYLPNKKNAFASYLSDLDQGSLFSKTQNAFLKDFYDFKKKKEELLLNDSFDIDLYPDDNKFFGVLFSKLRSASGRIGSLAEWTSLLLKLDDLETLLPKEYVSLFKTGKIKEKDLLSNFEKSLANSILSYRLKEDNLALLSSKEMNNLIHQYANDILEFSNLATVMTAAKISSSYPRDAFHFAESTSFNQLAKLCKNGGRGVSLRQIFHNYKDIIQNLTPCFMMSPISVSQFLDIHDYHFDVVIFDEASQIPTSEAISSIARGDSVVIAGDEEQMPPTSFFTTTIGNNDSDNAFSSLDEDLESLLDDALVLGLPRKRLLWHYRSRHESLIAFSNNKFYDNSLLTFPSPTNDEKAVSYRYVKGLYERGRGVNRNEAKEVVKEILRRLKDKELRTHSIGVITFNEAQQNVIEDMLDKETSKLGNGNLEPGGEKIFIKNLENVQGDERDVILFSTTYGPDKNGTISLNFGPLSLKKGERRLNVAVSRAREEMIVFSSLNPADIKAERAKNAGAQYLKDFLSFAKFGYDYLPFNASNLEKREIGVEKYLAEDIRKLGYCVEENLGESSFKIDLAISLKEKPSEYLLGVLLDNEHFANMTCRDRNINEPNILHRLGWNLCHIYAVEYLDHRKEVVQYIVTALNEILTNPNQEKEESVFKKKPLFIKQTMPKKSIPYTLSEEACDKKNLAPYLLSLIEYEGPISLELINRRYCAALGKKRVGSISRGEIDKALQEIGDRVTYFINDGTRFYVPKDFEEASFLNYRLDPENKSLRTLSDICYQEVANCAADILKEQGEMDMADLVKQISLVFGYKVLLQSKNAYLTKAIKDSSCKRNRIKVRESRVLLAE